MKSATLVTFGLLSALAGSPISAVGQCSDCQPTNLCSSQLEERRNNLTCQEAVEIALLHLDAVVRAGDRPDLALPIPEAQTKDMVAGLLCGDLRQCEPDLGDLASLIFQDNPEIAKMRESLIQAAQDRSLDSFARTISTELAVSADTEEVDWLVDLIDPRHGLSLQFLIPGIELMQDNEALMTRAIPKIVLVAQRGRNFHDRTSAMMLLLRNKGLIDTEVLIPLLLIAREGCSSTSDRVRRVAMEEIGPLAGELARILDEMCSWSKEPKSEEKEGPYPPVDLPDPNS